MTLLQQLSEWQKEQAQWEGVDNYMILPFETLKDIASILPQNNEELLAIKGIGPVKIKKYGQDILEIINGKNIQKNEESDPSKLANSYFLESTSTNAKILKQNKLASNKHNINDDLAIGIFDESSMVDEILKNGVNDSDEILDLQEDFLGDRKFGAGQIDKKTGEILSQSDDYFSVSEALDICNAALIQNKLKVRGEVTRVDSRARTIYFSLRDVKGKGIVNCLIFRNNYELSGVILEEGMEIIITATPEIYKPTGRFSLKVGSIELAGEGALQKAYEKLKYKFKKEGLFSPERKREISELSQKIGLITSRDGAAIGDFTTNLGSYGYKIIFCHSSVEGQNAVSEILQALKIMNKQDLDLLVIIRGGGSLESLQAFNNEKIVRFLADFSVPVIAGIGHEQDETLATLVADVGVSTPTAAARIVRESWDSVQDKIKYQEENLIQFYENILNDVRQNLENSSSVIFNFFETVKNNFQQQENAFEKHVGILGETIKNLKSKVSFYEKSLIQHSPERQLQLGYSIIRDKNKKVIRSVKNVKKDDIINLQLVDGEIESKVNKVKNL